MVRKDRVSVASSSSGRGSQTRSQTKHGEAAVKAVKARQRRKGDDSAYNKNCQAKDTTAQNRHTAFGGDDEKSQLTRSVLVLCFSRPAWLIRLHR